MSADVDDPAKRRTLKRIAAGTGGAATVAVGSTQVPRFSPVGRAQAVVPFVVGAAVGATIGAAFVAGMTNAPERGTAEYDHLQRIALWADGFRTFASNEATNETLDVTTSDLAEFAVNRLMAEASLKAMEEQHQNGATESEALAAGKEVIRAEGATMEENVLNEFYLMAQEAFNFLGDIAVVSDTDPKQVLEFRDYDSHSSVNSIEATDKYSVEIDLVDGSVYEMDTRFIHLDFQDSSSQRDIANGALPSPVTSEKASDEIRINGTNYGKWSPEDDGYPSGTEERTFSHGYSEYQLSDWPQSEYDNLDDESKENIDPPDDVDGNPLVFYDAFTGAFQEIYSAVSQAESEFETFLSNIWSDLEADDTDPSDFMTPTMLAQRASEEQTFPYATGALASMGVPTSAETVEVKFPNSTDDNGDVLHLTGQLFANPMPSSGFSEGSRYDPANLDSNIYMAAHRVNEDGEQDYAIQQVDEPFEITQAWEINEDGEQVETDGLTWGQQGFTGSETNYQDLINSLNEVAETQQQAEDTQREIVVDLEGGGGPGFSFPWDGDGGLVSWLLGLKLFGIPIWLPVAGYLGLGAYNRVSGD